MVTIKSARVAKGYTQSEIAKVIEKNVTTYSSKERGETSFSLDEVLRIVNFLDLSYDEFNEIFFGSKLQFRK